MLLRVDGGIVFDDSQFTVYDIRQALESSFATLYLLADVPVHRFLQVHGFVSYEDDPPYGFRVRAVRSQRTRGLLVHLNIIISECLYNLPES